MYDFIYWCICITCKIYLLHVLNIDIADFIGKIMEYTPGLSISCLLLSKIMVYMNMYYWINYHVKVINFLCSSFSGNRSLSYLYFYLDINAIRKIVIFYIDLLVIFWYSLLLMFHSLYIIIIKTFLLFYIYNLNDNSIFK